VIAHETGAASVADPLGGSWFVEALTDELERRAEAVFAHLLELGGGSMLAGVLEGIEQGWFQGEIADAAYDFERRVTEGRRVAVGVNRFTDGNDGPPPILTVSPESEELQLRRLSKVRAARDDDVVRATLAALTDDARSPEVNVMPAMVDAARARATVGEMVGALAEVFGTWVESPRL
jgi:methylmalonyl-CoA mutase N-terminal domain/subunit